MTDDPTTTPPFTIDEYREMNYYDKITARHVLDEWRTNQRLKCRRTHHVFIQRYYVKRLLKRSLFKLDGRFYNHYVAVSRAGKITESIC